MATEYEVADFLHGFIRLTKPQVLIETGCYRGDTAYWMAEALRFNRRGHLNTCDVNEEMCRKTTHRTKGMRVTAYHTTGLEMISRLHNVDFAFIDSGTSEERVAEIMELSRGRLSPVAWVFLHDAMKNHVEAYKEVAALTNWWNVLLPTERGLAMFSIGNAKLKNGLG